MVHVFWKFVEWRSILVSTTDAKDGLKNPLKSISMKFRGFGLIRPVLGWTGELRFRGTLQWHAGIDPFSVEIPVTLMWHL